MENSMRQSPPTFESVWALMQETTLRMQETDRIVKENARQMKENERIMNERFAETDRIIKENARLMRESRADYDRRMKKMDETMGSWAHNHGRFAEEYFVNSFENGKRSFFGEKFDEIEKNVKGIKKGFRDEYDLLLINGKTIGIIEIKFKAHENDIPNVLRKAETLRVNLPEYKDHRIYLGLATMSFYPELEEECIKEGIAVIKQEGDVVVINDKHLKVF